MLSLCFLLFVHVACLLTTRRLLLGRSSSAGPLEEIAKNEGPCAPLCPVWASWGLRRQRQKTRTAGSTRVFFFLFLDCGLTRHPDPLLLNPCLCRPGPCSVFTTPRHDLVTCLFMLQDFLFHTSLFSCLPSYRSRIPPLQTTRFYGFS